MPSGRDVRVPPPAHVGREAVGVVGDHLDPGVPMPVLADHGVGGEAPGSDVANQTGPTLFQLGCLPFQFKEQEGQGSSSRSYNLQQGPWTT